MNAPDVARYLLDHPEFFSTHAELLATIRLENPHGKGVISLQERQMEMLREKNKLLERRLANLLSHGHTNDQLATKFTCWSTRVVAEPDTAALPQAITQGLIDLFEVPHAAVRIWNVDKTYAHAEFASSVDEEVRLFANTLSEPYCGPNTGFKAAQWLARAPAPTEPDTQSIALIALRNTLHHDENGSDHNACVSDQASMESPPAFGLLVLGSPDPERFRPDMATDFLFQIGTLVSAALSRLLKH